VVREFAFYDFETGATFVSGHPRYATTIDGGAVGDFSAGASSEDSSEGIYGDACRRCRSTMKSRKHSIGTKYLRSAEENFVRKETSTFLPSRE